MTKRTEKRKDRAWKKLQTTIDRYCLPDAQDLFMGLYECMLADILNNNGFKVAVHEQGKGIIFHIYERLNCETVGKFRLKDLINAEDDDDDFLKLLHEEFVKVAGKIEKILKSRNNQLEEKK